mmetsp:Transcript_77294/g.198961  ORF Transcript_77294/g.198961 Transcript_77294/m.198961 type:complete len:141 (-) Transcript_77294:15-437(-)
MASNSLRGGKNIYSPHCLQSNWAEERLEPHHQEAAGEKAIQLPPSTAKTWSKSSEEYGAEHKEASRANPGGTETGNWLKYQATGSEMYSTTTGDTHCHPKDQTSPFQAPSKPEEFVTEYHKTWTKGDSHRFTKPSIGYQP